MLISNGDILSPLVLSIGSFALITFIAFIFNGFTYDDISLFTIVIILLSLIFFSIGFFIMYYSLGNKIKYSNSKNKTILEPSIIFSILILCIVVIVTIINYYETLSTAKSISSSANISNMLMYARNAELFTEVNRNVVFSILGFFNTASGYIYTYMLINNFILKKRVKRTHQVVMVMIVIFAILSQMLGTGRTFLIKYLTTVIVMFFYLNMLYRNKRNVGLYYMLNTLKYMSIILICFFIIFQLMGLTTNKTQNSSYKEILYLYSGASVVALDKDLKNYQPDDRFFGEESFYGLYGTLNAIGIEVPNDILHLPFVSLANGLRTNIYTSLRSYIHDFGYIGLFIVQSILGIISGVLYSLLKKYRANPIYLIVYSFFIYGIVMQGIEEIQLRNFMSLTNIFTILFFVILYYIISKKINIKI